VAIFFGVIALSVLLLVVLSLNSSARQLEDKLSALLQDQSDRARHVEQTLEQLKSESLRTLQR
jgi:hypothetical protein